MKVLGIVAEYNPFHNGHMYHLETSKKLTQAHCTVCVMSGNFIQRGEPALLNKWARTKMALQCGIDLIIELPVVYALQSAENFAFGAIKILNSLNIVDYICFGSETGKLDILENIAQILINEPLQVSQKIKYLLKSGCSFVKARNQAISNYMYNCYPNYNIEKIMSSPNNILAIEYLKAIHKLKSNICPVTFKRYKTDYHSLKTINKIASATAIRNILKDNKNPQYIKSYVPIHAYNILDYEFKNGRCPIFTDNFEKIIIALFRKLKSNQLALFPDVNEGLENRIKKAFNNYGTLEDIISSIKTKRYTRTKIQRIIFNVLLGITQNNIKTFNSLGGPQYIRVLGINNKGKKLLSEVTQKSSLPIIIKPSSYNKLNNKIISQMIEFDFIATDLYNLAFLSSKDRIAKLDLRTSPIII